MLLTARRLLNNLGFRINRLLYGYDPEGYNTEGVDVFARDWDILALLDACRCDVFRQYHDGPGKTECIQSRGSSTGEWYRGNVNGRQLHDTVVVGGSPAIRPEHHGAEFHAYDHVWRDAWDDELCTVPPDILTARAVAAAERYPNKRIFIHYLQPHYPFIGPTGRNFDYEGYEQPLGEKTKWWFQYGFRSGGATDEELWQAYLENVDIATDAVVDLNTRVNGKLAVTADHGQKIKGRAGIIPVKRYGHPPGFYITELLTVPWHEYPPNSRRKVVADVPNQESKTTPALARERLRDLGYIEDQGPG